LPIDHVITWSPLAQTVRPESNALWAEAGSTCATNRMSTPMVSAAPPIAKRRRTVFFHRVMTRRVTNPSPD